MKREINPAKVLVGYYNYTVILTYLGVACGILGVCFASTKNAGAALICLMVCGLCDTFDGTIARTRVRTSDEKRFGIQIDSLADIVCFGVLPAAIGLATGMTAWYEQLVLAIYVLCALIRLAYFNVTEDAPSAQQSNRPAAFQGLPVTAAAVLVPAIYTLRPLFPLRFHLIFALGMLLLAGAFIGKFRVKKPGLIGRIVLTVIGAAIMALLILGWNK